MAVIEAEIVEVSRDGVMLVVSVLFRRDGIEVDKQTLRFGSVKAQAVTEEILAQGARIRDVEALDVEAKKLIGQRLRVPDTAEAAAAAPRARP